MQKFTIMLIVLMQPQLKQLMQQSIHLRLLNILISRSVPRLVLFPGSPVDEVWNTLTTVLNFGRSKKNSNSTQFIEFYFGVSEQIKPLQPIGQAAEFKFESKFKPLQVIWQSLPKAVPEDNRRFRGQNQWPSF